MIPRNPRARLALALALSTLAHGFLISKPGWPPSARHSGPDRQKPEVLLLHLTPRPPERSTVRPRESEVSTPPPESHRKEPGPDAEESPASRSATPGQAPGLVFGPWYYPAKWLHRRPSPLKPIQPEYPVGFSEASGRVLLLLFINEEGTVDRHQLLSPTQEDAFAASAIRAFSAARYAPGMITGHVVRSQLLVDVTFEPGQTPSVGLPEDLPPGLQEALSR